MDMGNMVQLSIVIVTYNSALDIKKCLDSLGQITSVALEIIVVDNNSNDSTCDLIHEFYKNVKLVRNEKNMGFPAGNNIGFERCLGEYVLMLNPDTYVSSGSVQRMMRMLQEQPHVNIAGLDIINPDGSDQRCIHGHPSLTSLLLYMTEISKYSSLDIFNMGISVKRNKVPSLIEVGWVSGAAIVFKKTILNHLVGLDNNLFWMEDIDFCYRAKLAGSAVMFMRGVIVTHNTGQSANSNRTRAIYHQHTSKFKYVKKHFSSVEYLFTLFFYTMVICVKICLRISKYILFDRSRTNKSKIGGLIKSLTFVFTGKDVVWNQ